MPYKVMEERGFDKGVRKEDPSWLLPPGALADASNLIFDRPGIARQRNATTALVSGAQTANPTTLGFSYFDDPTLIEELYGLSGKTGTLNLINKTTGAFTSLGAAGTANAIYGRPVRHFGYVIFPGRPPTGTALRISVVVGGQTSSTSFSSTSSANITAGSPTATLGGADTTTNIKVGGVVQVSSATEIYHGRVVSIDSGTTFTVSPVPTRTINSTASGGLLVNPFRPAQGGTCAASFQNRLLYGNTNDILSTAAVTGRRVMYSPLPTETTLWGTVYSSGASLSLAQIWPALNYFEVPGSDPIVAMEPIDDDELLILTSGGVIRFRGTLATQTTTSAPGVTFDLSPLNTNAGCLSDLSVQRTPHGIIWASAEGVMLYQGGSKVVDLTEDVYHTAWLNLVNGASFAIHGSFYARNHYVVSGSSGGTTFSLAFNLDNQTWAPLTGVGTDIFLGVPRPSDPSEVFALRWWDQTGTAPSMTNGQTLRVESIFAPDVAGQTKLDADGAIVAFSAKTRTITDDAQTERILRRLSTRYALDATGANVTVAVGARLDSTVTGGTPTVSVGSLSNTSVLTISGQSNATPIVITTSTNHGLQDEDWVDIRGATPNTAANGRWKIDVLSAATFSLSGSVGNGATSATGTAKKVNEQELTCSAADIGQGHYLSIASSGTVNKFELHGARLGAMEMPRGMG